MQKASQQIIDALTELMEGFAKLQQGVEAELGSSTTEDEFDEENSELSAEVDAAIVTEMRSCLEAVMEAEDYSTEEFATMISTVTDALEEIDPDVFEDTEEEEEQEEEVEVYDEDEDYDDDEYYYGDDEEVFEDDDDE